MCAYLKPTIHAGPLSCEQTTFYVRREMAEFWATINFVGKMMDLDDEHNAASAQKASGTIIILYTSVNTLL